VSSLRVAVTIEQSWHRVPGGTAAAALAVARELVGRPEEVTQIGVTAWHRQPAPAPYVPPIEVRAVPLPRVVLYEAWHAVRRPAVQRATGPVAVVHATTLVIPPRSAPLVVTIHDLAFRHEPAHFTNRGVRVLERGLALARRDADLVLCSSAATLADCREAGFRSERLRLVPLGVDVAPVPALRIRATLARLGIVPPYLVFVGTLEPRKNLAGLLQALSRPGGHRLPLVVVGPVGWGEDLEALVVRSGLPRDRVRPMGFLSDDDKHAVCAGAVALCYPSLREGFGLPVLEAMALGTPVVTSKGTATEEAAAGAAVLVDPSSPDAIAEGIVEALGARADLVARGRARAAEMTWARTADLTLAAYREAAGR
jgi:glycosyltransferase involved in cell wall biosynthesis